MRWGRLAGSSKKKLNYTYKKECSKEYKKYQEYCKKSYQKELDNEYIRSCKKMNEGTDLEFEILLKGTNKEKNKDDEANQIKF